MLFLGFWLLMGIETLIPMILFDFSFHEVFFFFFLLVCSFSLFLGRKLFSIVRFSRSVVHSVLFCLLFHDTTRLAMFDMITSHHYSSICSSLLL